MHTIAERQINTRRIAGTDWPVYLSIQHNGEENGPYWIVQTCNQVGDVVETYDTLEEAEKDFNQMLFEQSPQETAEA